MSLKVKNCHSSNISQLKNKATLLYHYYQGQISDKPNILTMGRDSNILFSVLLLGGIADFLFNGYFTRFLKIGGEWYISGWLQLLQLFGHSRVFLFIIATMASLGIPFWTINLFFMSLDLKGKPAFLRKYKIQSDKNIPVDWKLYKKCITVINKNQLIATILVILMYPATQWGGMKYEAEDLPSLPRFFSEMLYFAIVQEIAFYYLHRLMHYPALYKHIHKVHHEWTAPISMAVVYVHPIEHIVVNMIPILLSPVLIGAHISTACIWYMAATFVSTIHHSGYHFPGFPSPQFHDYHHLKFNQCYGVLGWLDRLHNTDSQFRKSLNYKCDSMYFTLKPIWMDG